MRVEKIYKDETGASYRVEVSLSTSHVERDGARWSVEIFRKHKGKRDGFNVALKE